jgi:eukaryotic-like serine/threonine-protein kinase
VSLSPGTRLGSYEIQSAIGAGGMGEVYRARDTKLDRAVAIKILPESFAHDPERLARFEREAKNLAALNHPNIATIHGFEDAQGIQALVMELVEGPTLADRIAQGRIPLDEALPIARQIAEALEAAHEQGIVHRDLKPANVKLKARGAPPPRAEEGRLERSLSAADGADCTVKVLDFGLAKALEPAMSSADAAASPTITSPALMTGAGIILGTAAYMSPEQAKGRTADKRSDVWAFGCVLFEMLTGVRAFPGEDVSDTLAAVLRGEPDWGKLPADTPAAIRRLLRRCLTKDRRERLRDIGDARIEIQDAGTSEREATPAHPRADRLAWNVVLALAVVSLVFGFLFFRSATRPSDPAAVYRSLILPPVGDANAAASEARTGVPRFSRGLALSPDGRRLALVAPGPNGRLVLWIHSLDTAGARALVGTESASRPFWSPDGRHLAFVAEGKLKRIDASGGAVLPLYDGARDYSTGTWNRDNIILFAGADGLIRRISAESGDAPPVTSADANRESSHEDPFFLPDGRHFVYSANARGAATGGAVFVGSLDSQERTKLIDGAGQPAYANGFLLFVRDGILMAQRFDADRLEPSGEAMPLTEPLMAGGAPATRGGFSVSQTGVLVYQAGLTFKSALVWVEGAGRELGTFVEPRAFSYVQLSSDQRHVAVSVQDDATRNREIWVYDTARSGAGTRLTFEPSDDFSPVWSPSGDRLAFVGRRAGDRSLNLYEMSASGIAGEKRLADLDGVEIPTSWSSDGRFLLFQTPSPGADVMVLSIADAQVSPFANTRFTEGSAQFSPDGRWIAYSSNETNRTEVYVAPFQRTGARVPISTGGGSSPRWRRDGKELYYISGDDTLIAVEVTLGESSMDVGKARPRFRTRFRDSAFPYAVAADGRFLVNRFADDAMPPTISLIVNWPEALKK